jgi:hypothetical protein
MERRDEARAEYRALRALFVTTYGSGSVHVRNLDRQIALLENGKCPEVRGIRAEWESTDRAVSQ